MYNFVEDNAYFEGRTLTQEDFDALAPTMPPVPFNAAKVSEQSKRQLEAQGVKMSQPKDTAWNDGGESKEANIESVASEAPLPLRSPPQPQEPYPVEAFGSFTDTVKAFADGVKVPLSMAGASVLTALSFCTQGYANVHTKDGRDVPTALFALTIADSGDRKSALDRAVLQAIHTIEKNWYSQYQSEYKAFNAAKLAWEKLPKKEREANPFTMQEPSNPTMIMENVNSEGAFRQLKEGRPSVAFSSDEGGSFFGGQAFQKEHVLKTITFFSNLWDGKPIDKVRSGEGASRLYDRRASMHMMLQPHIAEKVLADELMQNQGFLPRFLIAYPQSLKGSRLYSNENVRQNPSVIHFYHACETLLAQSLRIGEETGGLILDTLCLDADAHTLWAMHHDNIEAMLVPNGELTLVSAFASKNAEQALRIAGVLTIAENSASRIITAHTMANAIQLAQWYLKEALRLRQDGTTSPEILKAERLLEWIQSSGKRLISVRLVQRNTSLDTKAKAEPIIKLLAEHGYLKQGTGSVFIEGISTKAFWEVVA